MHDPQIPVFPYWIVEWKNTHHNIQEMLWMLQIDILE